VVVAAVVAGSTDRSGTHRGGTQAAIAVPAVARVPAVTDAGPGDRIGDARAGADRPVAGAANRSDTGAADSTDPGASAAAARPPVIGNERRAHQRGGRQTNHQMTHHGLSFPARYLIATAAPCSVSVLLRAVVVWRDRSSGSCLRVSSTLAEPMQPSEP